MTTQIIRASERFTTSELSSEVLDGRALPLDTSYDCACGERLGFQRRDLEGARTSTRLRPEDAAEIEALAVARDLAGYRFLDWYCPGCRAARRVYCEPWSGGRHGDHGVRLLFVAECEAVEGSNA